MICTMLWLLFFFFFFCSVFIYFYSNNLIRALCKKSNRHNEKTKKIKNVHPYSIASNYRGGHLNVLKRAFLLCGLMHHTIYTTVGGKRRDGDSRRCLSTNDGWRIVKISGTTFASTMYTGWSRYLWMSETRDKMTTNPFATPAPLNHVKTLVITKQLWKQHWMLI